VDAVEKDGSAVGREKQALALSYRPRERSPLMTEPLGLEELRRERGAALRDESPVSSRTVEVDRARDQLLPRSALAEEEDGNRAIAEPFEDRDRLTHRRRAADDLIERVAGLEKLLVVAEVRVRDRELHGLLVDLLAELEPADLVVPPRSLESLDA